MALVLLIIAEMAVDVIADKKKNVIIEIEIEMEKSTNQKKITKITKNKFRVSKW